MRFASTIIATVSVIMLTTPASAEQGNYSAPLEKMLTQTAAGTCPADIMATDLLAACQAQLERMRPALAAAGPVTSVSFVAAEGQASDRVETYKVTFAKGETATWHIGRLRDGKFATAYSNGN